MSEHNELTPSEQRGYTGRMSEGSTGVMDRPRADTAPPKSTESVIRESQYKALAELEAKRNRQREERLAIGAEIGTKKDNEPVPPETKLNNLTDDDTKWAEFGWNKNERDQLEQFIIDRFLWDRNDRRAQDRANNALQMILASGNTGADVMAKLANREKLEADVAERMPPNIDPNRNPHEYKMYRDFATLKVLSRSVQERRDEQGNQLDPIVNEVPDKYIQRFVLDDEFREELDSKFKNETPANFFELAWNIAMQKPDEFGVNGKFPILEMRVEKGRDGRPRGKYYPNQANFMRWVRQWINHYQGKSPDDLTNYFTALKIEKAYKSVSLDDILDNTTQYLTDDNGDYYETLADQAQLEPWMLITVRQYDLEYKGAMNSEEALAKKMGELFQQSKLTKKTFQKSMMYYFSTLGVDFDGAKSDSNLGGALTTMFLAYYNISDFSELQRILGKDSSFFTKDGLHGAMKSIMNKKAKRVENPSLQAFLSPKDLEKFDKIYDANGKLRVDHKESVDYFLKFVNVFASQWTDHNAENMVKEMLMNAVKEKYDFKSKNSNRRYKTKKEVEEQAKKEGREVTEKDYLIEDDDSLEIAWLIAFSFLRFSGAGARNDTGAAGYDAESKWMNTEAYRRKMATEKRGGAMGNPYTIPMYKGMIVDLMQGIRTTDAWTTRGLNGEETAQRKKTPLEVMMELHEVMRIRKEKCEAIEKQIAQERNPDRKAQLVAELDNLEKSGEKSYKQVAGQMEFPQLALANYAANHLQRGAKIYGQIMGAEEITFDKFTHHDVIKGVVFNRGEFQKAVQENLIKPTRYLWDTYGELNFNMPVRRPMFIGREGDKDIFEYKTVPLGEALFGYQMLDIPMFWKHEKVLGPDGKPLKDAKGKDIEGKKVIKRADGRHEIDYDKVASEKGQTALYKQFVLMKFAGDMWTHIDRHSSDPTYDYHHFLEIIEALERIPAEIIGNDKDMRDVRVSKSFFSHAQIKWLRKMAKVDNYSLFKRQFIDDIFGGGHDKKGSGFGDSFSMIANAVFRGF